MPTVPRYSQKQVQESGFPNNKFDTNTSAETFGGGQGLQEQTRAIGGLAAAASKIAEEERNKAHDAEFTELDRLQSEEQTRIEIGLTNMKGKSAVEAEKFASEQWHSKSAEILGKARSEEVKYRLRQAATVRLGNINKKAMIHTATEMDRFHDEQSDAYLKTTRNEAIENAYDPERVSQSLFIQEEEVKKISQRKGESPEMAALRLAEVRTNTHAGVIERMLANGDDMKASEYFARNKGQIEGEAVSKIESALEEGSLRGASQRQSDALMVKYPDSMTDALEEARKIKDPKLRDEVTSRLKDRFSLKAAAEQADVENLHRRATDIIDQTGDIDKIPPGEWARFDLSERSALKQYAKAKREGTEIVTDFATYYELRTMASTPEMKDQFLKLNLAEPQYLTKLGKTEREALVDIQAALRVGQGKADKTLDDWRTEDSIVNGVLDAADVDKKNDPEKVALFRNRVAEQARRIQAQTGKPATNEDYERIANDLMVNIVTHDGVFWDTKKPLYELEDDESGTVKFKDIPAKEKKIIEQKLRSNGIPVSDSSIEEIYNAKINRMVGQ